MTTPILGMGEIAESQANKYITHNEALRRMEALSFRALSRTTTAQPSAPAAGDVYIIPANATGADWSGQDGNVGYYDGSVWHFVAPFGGITFWVVDDGELITYDGTGWIATGDAAIAAHETETETHGAPTGERLVHTGDMQNSDTDTTSGALLRVGAFGLGETYSQLTITDYDDTSLPAGFYQGEGANAVNPPPGSTAYGACIVTIRNGNPHQLAYFEDEAYLRRYDGTAWRSWVALATEARTNDFTTMPQVGGAPIVESGSNSDGEWVRYADGTQLCYKNIEHDMTTKALNTYPYPIYFSGPLPAGSYCSGSQSYAAGSSYTEAGGMVLRIDSFSNWSFGNPTGNSTDTSHNFRLSAIGRWK